MAIDFPATSGQATDGSYTHTASGITWAWDGTTWKAQGVTGSYVLPTASATVLGGIKVGTGLSINSSTGILTATGGGGGSYTDSDVDTHLNTSTAADGEVLSWNATTSDYDWVAQSGGSSLSIQDEGSALSTAATTLNFVGAGVTASGTGATKTITISGGGGTVSSGTFNAIVNTPSSIDTYAYDSAELVFEYTVFVKNSTNYQSQKLLVMRDGTTVTSTQYGVMFSNTLLVQIDATISGSNLLLRATPESGVTGNTTFRIKREVT